MLKLSVSVIIDAHCPKCGREGLPLGENPRHGVVAVCPGCGWEHEVRFLREGSSIETRELLGRLATQLQEALGRMELPHDIHLTPVRERRESRTVEPIPLETAPQRPKSTDTVVAEPHEPGTPNGSDTPDTPPRDMNAPESAPETE